MDESTKDTLLSGAKDNEEFFSNKGKQERERWVIDRYCESMKLQNPTVCPGNDPPDYIVNGQSVVICEALPPDRKRHKEYREEKQAYESGDFAPRFSENESSSLEKVKKQAHEWILDLIKNKNQKYKKQGSDTSDWTLLIYANYSWSDKTDWNTLHHDVAQLKPDFKHIDVLYSVSNSLAIIRVY